MASLMNSGLLSYPSLPLFMIKSIFSTSSRGILTETNLLSSFLGIVNHLRIYPLRVTYIYVLGKPYIIFPYYSYVTDVL
jgi:hypothetical protein